MSIKKPNPANYNPDPDYLRLLIKDAGLTQEQAAKQIGVSQRALGYYLASRSNKEYRVAPYSVQFALECLAEKEDGDHARHPQWMLSPGFGGRLRDALTRAGYKDPGVLTADLRREPDNYWLSLENFGPRCLRELKSKWPLD